MSSFFKKNLVLQDLLFLTALSTFFLTFRLGNGSIASWDEGIYASVAKEMFQSGDWFRLTLNGSLWADKPPLAIWVTAFFYQIFGVNEFAARLFSALCGVGTVIVTYLIGERLFNRWVGFLGALVLLSSSHFIRFARFGMLDVPLTFFLSLSLYFFWRGYERNRYLIFSGISAGLAILTKGFAGFLIFPISWLYCVLSGEHTILFRSSYWIGMMLAAGVALPWNLFEMINHRDIFMKDVVVKHLFQRTFSSLDGHTGNYYFHIRTLVNKYHPWVLIGIFSGPFFLLKSIRERIGGALFLSVWMFFILLVFTLVKTKLAWYIVPAYPALSLSVGYVLTKLFSEKHASWLRIVFIGILALHVFYSHILDLDYSRDIKGLAPAVNTQLPQGHTIFLYNYHETNAVSFYMSRSSRYVDSHEEFASAAKEPGNFYCLVHKADTDAMQHILREQNLKVAASFENLNLVVKNT